MSQVSNLQTVPAELGLVLFAFAGGLFVTDKFANMSANWLRYWVAAMALDRRLVEFQIDWARLTLTEPQSSSQFSEAGAQADESNVVEMPASATPAVQKPEKREPTTTQKLDLIGDFLGDVFDLTEQECNEWAKQFRQSQSELAQYLKLKQIEPTERPSRRRPSGAR
jgi:hypothetical protein